MSRTNLKKVNLSFRQFIFYSLAIRAVTAGRTERLVLEFFPKKAVNAADTIPALCCHHCLRIKESVKILPLLPLWESVFFCYCCFSVILSPPLEQSLKIQFLSPLYKYKISLNNSALTISRFTEPIN